ncbi:MAG: DUF6362 family protein [Magnetococcus sp. YQC-5]
MADDTQWTPKMVRDRINEAAKTLRLLQVTGLRPIGYGSSWPDIVHDPNEAFGWNPTKVRLGPPTPDAITRMDEALIWLLWLDPEQIRLVWLHADGVERKKIQIILGVGNTKLWSMWAAAIMNIVTMLNRKYSIKKVDVHPSEGMDVFWQAYQRTQNATEAYRKAFSVDGLSDGALRARAFRLAKKFDVTQATEHLM